MATEAGTARKARTLTSVAETRRVLAELRGSRAGRARAEGAVPDRVSGSRAPRVALVPTMGSLHEGHLSLVDRARAAADIVVVSVFVNPTQFGPDEDYEAYPRDLERDVERASARGADLVFAPPASEMYPREQTVWVDPGPLADRLCGASRPGHFRGVLTVVLKLLNIVRPEVAVFGRKDYQQAVLIGRMVEELHLPVQVERGPIVRDEDGLALSSRNDYLSAGDREAARSLSRALTAARSAFADGTREAERLVEIARETLERGGAVPEYVEVVGPADLQPVERAAEDTVCAIAAHVSGTRLIDNATLAGTSSLEGGP